MYYCSGGFPFTLTFLVGKKKLSDQDKGLAAKAGTAQKQIQEKEEAGQEKKAAAAESLEIKSVLDGKVIPIEEVQSKIPRLGMAHQVNLARYGRVSVKAAEELTLLVSERRHRGIRPVIMEFPVFSRGIDFFASFIINHGLHFGDG